MLNLQEIFSFIEVVKEQGFSKASRKTGVPKSTLSRHVQNLEERLALNLFQRTTRRLTLTKAGEDFYHEAQGLTQNFENLEKRFQLQSQNVAGLIRLTSPQDMAGLIFTPAIRSFKKIYPLVQFDLFLSDERTDLIDAHIDLALRAGRLQDSSFIAKKVMEVQFRLYCGNHFSWAKTKKMEELPLIDFTRRPFESLKFKHRGQGSGQQTLRLKQKPEISTNSLAANAALVAQGLGVCSLPSYMGENYIQEGKLKTFLPEWAAPIEPVHLVYPSQAHLPLRVRLFIDHFVKELSSPSISKA